MKKMAIAMVLFLFVVACTICNGEEFSRKNKGEFFVTVQTLGISDTEYPDNTYEFDNTNLYGLGFGFNLDDHFNINTDLLFGGTESVSSDGFEANDNICAWNLNLDYNILKSALTPCATGGIGFMSMTGDVEGVDYQESHFSYNLGAGVRWDITNALALKVMYRALWAEWEGADGASKFDGISASVLLKF
jgi:opacity protein-like surface antigen